MKSSNVVMWSSLLCNRGDVATRQRGHFRANHIRTIIAALLWCVVSVGCVAKEAIPVTSAASAETPIEYYSMNNFPQQLDRVNHRYTAMYRNKEGKIYIASVKDIKNGSVKNAVYSAHLYEFPSVKKTDIEFLVNKANDSGYEELPYALKNSIKIDGKRYGFGGMANKVCTLPFSVKFNVGNYVYPIKGYKYVSGYEKSVMFFAELPTGLVNIYGDIYEDGNTWYVIDEKNRIVMPINKQVSFDDYCNKPHLFALDMNGSYNPPFGALVNFESCELDEPGLKSLIVKAKQEECK